MKNNEFPQDQKPAGALRPTPVLGPHQNESNFTPSPDEVARKAYFTYVNQGSRQGHEVQHWLQAEMELIQERNLTRGHRPSNWDMK